MRGCDVPRVRSTGPSLYSIDSLGLYCGRMDYLPKDTVGALKSGGLL